jgi:hypothetical protein
MLVGTRTTTRSLVPRDDTRLPGQLLLIVAEGEGFEPSRRCYRLRDFQSRALGQAMRPFQTGHSVFGYQLAGNLRRCIFDTWLIADSQ